ncbi:MAG: hypothetical protein J6P74_07865 [Paludibacteraceae bacterium]|nr:hypothetical protein [Paludibacteraceae bacterium]
MKKLILLAAAATFAFAANAKVWRINYDENANADFRTFKAACSSSKVANSDTLYCEPGYHAGSAEENVINRKGMKVFGPGWGYESNYGNTSTIADARFTSDIIIQANNILISGIVCNAKILFEHKVMKGITLERCKLSSIYGFTTNVDTLSNLTIKNCRIQVISLDYPYAKEMKNIYICNNLFVSNDEYGKNTAIGMNCNNWQNISNVNILRNTIVFSPYYQWSGNIPVCPINALIQDNIIINPKYPTKVIDFNMDRGNRILKNVLSLAGGDVDNAEIVTNYPDNYYVEATEASTFTCTQSAYRSEQYFQLKDGSPAKNAAYDGGDCGAFGGSTPFIICGRPQGIPYITDVEVPAQPKDNKLTVTFKVANQNE